MHAFARISLGVSENEFWKLTARELHAYCEQYNRHETKHDTRTALICYTMASGLGIKRKNGHALTFSDFLPGGAQIPAKQAMSWQQMKAQLQLVATMSKVKGKK